MSNWLEKYSAKVMGDFYDAIEASYREKVHEIEGSAPSEYELRKHTQSFLDPDGKTTLAWKGLPIVEWDAMPMRWSEDGTKAVITFRKLKTKP